MTIKTLKASYAIKALKPIAKTINTMFKSVKNMVRAVNAMVKPA